MPILASVNAVKSMQKIPKYIIGALATVAGLFFMWYFSDIVIYILVAAVLAIMGGPLVRILQKIRIKNHSVPNWLAALVTLVVMIGVGVAFFVLFIPLISNKLTQLAHIDAQGIMNTLQIPIAKLEGFLHDFFAVDTTEVSITNSIVAYLSKYLNMDIINKFLASIMSIIGNAIVAVFSIVFMTFFFLKDDQLFLKILLAIFPSKYEGNIKHALGSATHLLSRYFLGILTESTIMMILVSVSLMICGFSVSNAIFIGLIVGVLNVIPYVGPWLGFGISVVVSIAFVSADMTMLYILLSVGFTVLGAQLIDNIILQPVLYSNSVNAHPLEIFIVMLMAGYVGGILGMVLAVPAYTVIRVIAKEFFNRFRLVQKLTENM